VAKQQKSSLKNWRSGDPSPSDVSGYKKLLLEIIRNEKISKA